MRKITLLLLSFAIILSTTNAQLTTLPDGGNKKAMVGERIGITDVVINYNRPAVKGREGKVWGELVPAGFNDLGFGSSKAAPWRAGANENTTIQFSDDVKIEGKDLPAGKYGFFVAYGPDESTLIFSRNTTSWGSFFYDEKEDALRVRVKPVALDKNVEWLKYEFIDETENSAVITLQWEKLSIPFKVEVDYVKTQLESFRKELRSEKSFNPGWQSFNQAAQFTITRNVHLEEGLKWANQAISEPFIGQANFATLSTKASILTRLGRIAEADSIMKQSLPMGTVQQLHTYARQLVSQKKKKEALQVFEINFKKNPKEFTTIVGMARGYSANGDYKNALKYAQMALPLAPPGPNKTNVEHMIEKLKKGEDVN